MRSLSRVPSLPDSRVWENYYNISEFFHSKKNYNTYIEEIFNEKIMLLLNYENFFSYIIWKELTFTNIINLLTKEK